MNSNNSERAVTYKKEKNLTIWAAIGPNGELVKSSVGTFKAVAQRWALRRGNYEVVRLGSVRAPATAKTKSSVSHREVRGPSSRPSKVSIENSSFQTE